MGQGQCVSGDCPSKADEIDDRIQRTPSPNDEDNVGSTAKIDLSFQANRPGPNVYDRDQRWDQESNRYVQDQPDILADRFPPVAGVALPLPIPEAMEPTSPVSKGNKSFNSNSFSSMNLGIHQGIERSVSDLLERGSPMEFCTLGFVGLIVVGLLIGGSVLLVNYAADGAQASYLAGGIVMLVLGVCFPTVFLSWEFSKHPPLRASVSRCCSYFTWWLGLKRW
eukprot:TRINITY_DN46520_c0_g1_i1.p1 TRINITY_DN46520_c0_g1~~TRINITY_DN46520_c0_g1_i1.p1  ORF type:complete len:223 (-),score=34.63 TRINITY_DN46520_c0_g1_i1:292-960(-)